jgi:hypothetical protein
LHETAGARTHAVAEGPPTAKKGERAPDPGGSEEDKYSLCVAPVFTLGHDAAILSTFEIGFRLVKKFK